MDIEEFKDGRERLEYLVESNIEQIYEVLNNKMLKDVKEVIELRFGLKDGIEHTLDETAFIMNNKDKETNAFDVYKKMIVINMGYTSFNWTMESVRHFEAQWIFNLKNIIKNLK